jgi:NAD(P)-dependent dehydrogenase (short-subunit alcohol dehydrogenase family)
MATLHGKQVAIVGGSEGIGREMVSAALTADARTLAVARRPGPLAALAQEYPGVLTLSADAADETTADRVFEIFTPDVLVVCGGATPHFDSLQSQSWATFSVNWENDVRATFNFLKASLNKPLSRGAVVVVVSSGAGLNGSPRSGGYAGAKRMQMFLTEYAQEESERLGLAIRFRCIVPMNIMPATGLGQKAVEDYARYRGMTQAQFMARFENPKTPADIANDLIALVSETP